MIETKKCTKCLVEKQISDFLTDKYSRDGFTSRCRYCKNPRKEFKKECEDLPNEIWIPIKEYEKDAMVSNFSRVKTLNKIIEYPNGVKTRNQGRLLKQSVFDEYLSVVIQNQNKKNKMSVHRLVAIAFIPNPLNLPEVNHKNGIKHDNRIQNLEWVTSSYNSKHAYDNGLRTANIGGAKLNKEQVVEIRKLKDSMSCIEIAKKYNVTHSAISMILNRKTWKNI